MSKDYGATWRDGVTAELAEIHRGLKDLGRNFDDFKKKVLDGNGQPGLLTQHDNRLRALEAQRERRAWVSALWGVFKAALSVIAAGVALALLKRFLHLP